MKRIGAIVLAAGLVLTLLPGQGAGAVNAPLATVVSANPVDNTPHVVAGKIFSYAEVGSKIVVAGQFTEVRNHGTSARLPRVNVFAFDKVTRKVDTAFVPLVNGAVNVVEPGPEGDTVFLGGAFTTVNGATAPRLVKLRIGDGSLVTTFNSTPTAQVWDLAQRNGTLYVGGQFTKIKGQSRGLLAAVNATTGAVSAELNLPASVPIKNAASVKKLDVTPDGSKLVIVGNFQVVNGVSKKQVALIDLTTSPDTLADWHTSRYDMTCSASFDTYMRDVDFAPDGSYFVIVTTGATYVGSLCDTAARWETSATGSAVQPTWVDYSGGDTLYSVANTNAAVYVGGHQRWMNNRPTAADVKRDGAVDRSGIAALDPLTGLPLTWNPGRNPRGVGAQALLATADGLYVGSDTDKIANEYHQKIAFFPLAGGTPNPQPAATTLPADLFRITGDTVDRRAFDGTAALGAPVEVPAPAIDGVAAGTVRGAFMVNGQLYAGLSDGTLRRYSWDGTRFVAGVNLNSWTSFAGVRSLAYQNGKLYFTVNGDSRLYWRWFVIESGIVGSELFTADSGAAGVAWGSTVGLTVAAGKAYAAQSDGRLVAVTLDSAGVPVAGSATQVSGPGVDAENWNVTDLFAWSA